MKDAELIPQDDVNDYLRDLWETDEFKAAHDDNDSFLHGIIDTFCEHSRGFFKPSEPVEQAHFLTWMNFILHRDYDNPYLHDLYYLHEITHLAHLSYDADVPFYTWFDKMQENELRAAVTSEVLIHLHMKVERRSIRDKAFNKAIWADEWLPNVEPGNKPSQRLIDEIYAKRRAIITDQVVDDLTAQEQVLQRYNKQNVAWAKIWRNKYKIVEAYLQRFTEHDEACGDDEALRSLYQDLQQHSDDNVIFRHEAERFHHVYKAFNTLTEPLTGEP